MKEYYKTHREQMIKASNKRRKPYRHEYYMKHRKSILKRHMEWYWRNREDVLRRRRNKREMQRQKKA
jgi:hypothetical protein